ncbi:iron uptake transporter permease EfeU [Gryllotalpicola reticulitermitis]|uniref:Iron uptake transporter permease EfeU n=1 Tax=Gryllotalpicola reticulitermitis TaxID=1184153 RepID=A0ABV8Q3B3_9MICO
MLPTLIIGLREGLEAALIVGIIAAFLRSNGKKLLPMWVGVGLAVALSIAVGIVLRVIEEDLPQAGQEGMESVIGAIAVVFVTGMIVWMNSHSREMKRELEAEAGAALREGHAYALAGMAFLAVLKEGFETSVFLLATFSASTNATLAVTGAVIGVLAAVGIGIGIYAGSVRLNLSTFFRWTGAFLILVAAGLVLTTLRTAHEAGWLIAGQQQVLNLNWLVAPGSIQAALITGVLGIPADPRLIEVVGWLSYLIPVALFVYWPRARRARGMQVARLQFWLAGAVAAAAIVLAVAAPRPVAPAAHPVTIDASTTGVTDGGTAELHGNEFSYTFAGRHTTVRLDRAHSIPDDRNGISATKRTVPVEVATSGLAFPKTVTLDQLISFSGGRVPVGINASQNPGPYTATWTMAGSLTVWTSDGVLLDAQQTAVTAVTVAGGGLTTPRTIAVSDVNFALPSWQVASASAQKAADTVGSIDQARTEHALWGIQVPIALLVIAAALAVAGLRTRRRQLRAETSPRNPPTSPQATPQRSHSYAAQ